MFKQEKNVANFFLFAQRHELPLQTKAGGVIDGAELEDGDQILFATNLRGFPQTDFSPERARKPQSHFAFDPAWDRAFLIRRSSLSQYFW